MRLQLFVIATLLTKICVCQQIDLKIEQNCKSSIALDGKILTNDATYDLPITGSGLHFNISKLPKNKNVTMRIQSPITPVLDITLDSFFFNITTSFSTNEKLVTVLGGKVINLKRDFTITIGCSGIPNGTASCNFHPVVVKKQETSVSTTQPTPNIVLLGNQPLQNTENNTREIEKTYHPGSAVIDALYLSNDPTSIQLSDFNKILQYYFGESFKPGDIPGTIVNNKFLKEVFNDAYTQNLHSDNIAESGGGGIFSSLSLSSIGGLDVTNLTDGLARFLVKRAKEELSISFFKKFKETLEEQDDLKTLFPATTIVLGSISNEIYDYERYIQNLREAFKKDIQNLVENIPGLIPNHQPFFDNHKNLKASLNSGCYIVSQLQQQVHPGDILSNYPLKYLEEVDKDWTGSVQLLQLVSASLRDTASTDSAYWVSIKYLRQLVANQRAFKIYLGFLYQLSLKDFDGVKFEKSKSFANFLDATVANNFSIKYYQVKTFIMQFAEKADVLNGMIKNYTKPANDSLALELYKKYFDGAIDLFDYAFKVGDLTDMNNVKFIADLKDKLQPYFTVGNLVTDLIIDINRKNYSSAINNTVELYNFIIIQPLDVKNAELPKTTLQQLVKYGNFMATVSTAKTSKEVSDAIEAFALPTGSARIKRETSFNVSLNAYAGLFLGSERIRGYDDKIDKGKFFNTAGITAPIGIAISIGNKKFLGMGNDKQKHWSYSLFASLIDIGAVTAFRFKNDTTTLQNSDTSAVPAQVPTIQLKNILSPGVFLSVGIPKCPLSVNLGVQVGPNLRKISLNENGQTVDVKFDENKLYLRYSISICVDIPLLNFYTKSR